MYNYYLPTDLIKSINNEYKDKKINKLNTYLQYITNDIDFNNNTLVIDMGKYVKYINKITNNRPSIKIFHDNLKKTIAKYNNIIFISNEIKQYGYKFFYNNIIRYIISKLKKNCILVYFRYGNDYIKYKLINMIIKNHNFTLLYMNTCNNEYSTLNENYGIQIYNNINFHELRFNINFNDF
jgi:hypothetical protein